MGAKTKGSPCGVESHGRLVTNDFARFEVSFEYHGVEISCVINRLIHGFPSHVAYTSKSPRTLPCFHFSVSEISYCRLQGSLKLKYRV
jgi:hypothetical protein